MLSFSRKFRFPAAALAQVLTVTPGATVFEDGSFEVATDDDLTSLGGVAVPISDLLAFRVTAQGLERLFYWVGRLSNYLPWVAITRQQGYWQPTNSFEDSWLLETQLSEVPADLLAEITAWMVDQDQQAVYLELGGKALIYDRDEVPAIN